MWWSLWWTLRVDVGQTSIYRAVVQNKAQLAYSHVGPWLEGKAGPDAKVAASAELQAQLRLQDEAAVALRAQRVTAGRAGVQQG